MLNKEKLVLGLDLGNSTSSVSYFSLANNRLYTLPTLFDSKLYLNKENKFQSNLDLDSVKGLVSDVKRAIVSYSKIKAGDKEYNPIIVLGHLFRFLKKEVEKETGYPANFAVITVPAYFQEDHREAVREAAKLAKIDVIRVISEPVAALIYKKYKSPDFNSNKVLVIDPGSLTFDSCLCSIFEDTINVLKVEGNNDLGYSIIEKNLIEHVKKEYELLFDQKLDSNSFLLEQELKTICEQAKMQFSKTAKITDYSVMLDLQRYDSKLKTFMITFKKEFFEEMHKEYFLKVEELLKKIVPRETPIDLILVGGTANSEYYTHELLEIVKKIGKINSFDKPDAFHSVSRGAAIHGSRLLEKSTPGFLLLDVLPISIGVQKNGRYMHKIIAKNTKIPCKKEDYFTTNEDFQTSIVVKILQGEEMLAAKCKKIGSLILNNIKPARKGEPKITISLEIDEQGFLKVTASTEDGLVKELHVDKFYKNGVTNTEASIVYEETFNEENSSDELVELNKQLENLIPSLLQHLTYKKEEPSVVKRLNTYIDVVNYALTSYPKTVSSLSKIYYEVQDYLKEIISDNLDTYKE